MSSDKIQSKTSPLAKDDLCKIVQSNFNGSLVNVSGGGSTDNGDNKKTALKVGDEISFNNGAVVFTVVSIDRSKIVLKTIIGDAERTYEITKSATLDVTNDNDIIFMPEAKSKSRGRIYKDQNGMFVYSRGDGDVKNFEIIAAKKDENVQLSINRKENRPLLTPAPLKVGSKIIVAGGANNEKTLSKDLPTLKILRLDENGLLLTDENGRIFNVTDKAIIGRSKKSDIRFSHKGVSKLQGVIEKRANGQFFYTEKDNVRNPGRIDRPAEKLLSENDDGISLADLEGATASESSPVRDVAEMAAKKGKKKGKIKNPFAPKKTEFDAFGRKEVVEKLKYALKKIDDFIVAIEKRQHQFIGEILNLNSSQLFPMALAIEDDLLENIVKAYKLPEDIAGPLLSAGRGIATSLNHTAMHLLTLDSVNNVSTQSLVWKQDFISSVEEKKKIIESVISKIETYDASDADIENDTETENKEVFISSAEDYTDNTLNTLNIVDKIVNDIFSRAKERSETFYNKLKASDPVKIENKVFPAPTYNKSEIATNHQLADGHEKINVMVAEQSFSRAGKAQIKNPEKRIQNIREMRNKIDYLQKAVLGGHLSPEQYFKTLKELRKKPTLTFKTDLGKLLKLLEQTQKLNTSRQEYVAEILKNLSNLENASALQLKNFDFLADNPAYAENITLLEKRNLLFVAARENLSNAGDNSAEEIKAALDELAKELSAEMSDATGAIGKNEKAPDETSAANNEDTKDEQFFANEVSSNKIPVDFRQQLNAAKNPRILKQLFKEDAWNLSFGGNHPAYSKQGNPNKIPVPSHSSARRSNDLRWKTLIGIFKEAGWYPQHFPSAEKPLFQFIREPGSSRYKIYKNGQPLTLKTAEENRILGDSAVTDLEIQLAFSKAGINVSADKNDGIYYANEAEFEVYQNDLKENTGRSANFLSGSSLDDSDETSAKRIGQDLNKLIEMEDNNSLQLFEVIGTATNNPSWLYSEDEKVVTWEDKNQAERFAKELTYTYEAPFDVLELGDTYVIEQSVLSANTLIRHLKPRFIKTSTLIDKGDWANLPEFAEISFGNTYKVKVVDIGVEKIVVDVTNSDGVESRVEGDSLYFYDDQVTNHVLLNRVDEEIAHVHFVSDMRWHSMPPPDLENVDDENYELVSAAVAAWKKPIIERTADQDKFTNISVAARPLKSSDPQLEFQPHEVLLDPEKGVIELSEGAVIKPISALKNDFNITIEKIDGKTIQVRETRDGLKKSEPFLGTVIYIRADGSLADTIAMGTIAEARVLGGKLKLVGTFIPPLLKVDFEQANEMPVQDGDTQFIGDADGTNDDIQELDGFFSDKPLGAAPFKKERIEVFDKLVFRRGYQEFIFKVEEIKFGDSGNSETGRIK
ncbi:MAG: FHA domain-containing protein, partial [Pseudomonadota bacterium]